MPAAYTLAPLTAAQVAALEAALNATRDAERRLRYQMVLLAHQGEAPPAVARRTLRRPQTVLRVLHRYAAGGLAGVPRRTAPGAAPTVAEAWRPS